MTNNNIAEQRRHLIILFTDIASSSYIARQMEPEEYRSILEKIRQKLNEKVTAHEGTVIRIDGDGMLCVFGYPDVTENAVYEAAKAALEMHKAVAELQIQNPVTDGGLKLKTAIHSGIVLTVPGNLESGRLEILGEPTNLTSHLCDYAGPDEILITDETLGRFTAHFDIVQKREIKLKGRLSSVRVNKIIGLISDDAKLDSITYCVPFSGRELIMRDLFRFIENEIGIPQLNLLQGAAGLGKSRIVRELSSQLTKKNTPVFRVNCEGFLGAKILQPITQIINLMKQSSFQKSGAFDNKSQDLLDEIKQFIIASPNSISSGGSGLELLSNKFLALLSDWNQEKIVLIIDDWHWVDNASRSFIGNLLKTADLNLRIILTSREFDPLFCKMHNGETIELGSLESADVSSIINATIPNIEPFTKQRILRYSDGNPLYVEELCHAVNDGRFGFVDYQPHSWMNSLVIERFSQLPKRQAEIVTNAAIIGHTIPEWMLESVVGKPIEKIVLTELEKSDFLFPEKPGYLRFKHRITRDVIYQLIGLNERREIHQKVIEATHQQSKLTEGYPSPDLLAYHYAKCGNFEESIKYSKVAGDVALKATSLDKAQAHFKHALELSNKTKSTTASQLSLLHRYGSACIVDPHMSQTLVLEKQLSTAKAKGNNRLSIWCAFWLGMNQYGLGQPQIALQHLKFAFRGSDELKSQKSTYQIMSCLGQAYAAAGQYKIAFEHLDRAISWQTRSLDANTIPSLAYAISCKGFALGDQGKFDEAYECFDQADKLFDGVQHEAQTSILNHRTCVNLWHGNFDRAEFLTKQVMHLAESVHSRHNYAMAFFMNSAIRFYSDGHDKYIDSMIEATGWLWNDRIFQNLSLNFGCISLALARRERWEEARIYAARGLQRARLGDRTCESQIMQALALIAKNNQCHKPSEYYLAQAYRSAEERQSSRALENTLFFEKTYFESQNLTPEERTKLFYAH